MHEMQVKAGFILPNGVFADSCQKSRFFDMKERKIYGWKKKVYEIRQKNDRMITSGILPQIIFESKGFACERETGIKCTYK